MSCGASSIPPIGTLEALALGGLHKSLIMICQGCKNDVSEGEKFCALCKEKIQRHLKAAKEYLNQYEFQEGIEELSKVLEIDRGNQEARDLKGQTEEKINTINELKTQAGSCFKESLYKKANFYLDEVLKINPLDESVKLQKQMFELASLTDPMSFVRKSRQKFQPSDWAKVNYSVPSVSIVLVISLVGMLGLVSLVSYIIYNQRAKEVEAKVIYENLQKTIARREYYDAAFLSDYNRLIQNYSPTKYAKKIRQDFRRIGPEIIQRYLVKGKEYFNRGKYREAINEYSKVFAIELFHREAALLIKEANKKITLKKISLSPPEKKLPLPVKVSAPLQPEIPQEISLLAREHLARGEHYFQQQEYFKAIIEWEKAKELAPQEDKEKIQAFIEKAKTLQKSKEEEYRALIEGADKFFIEQNWQEAALSYEKALKIKPNDLYLRERLRQLRQILTAPRVVAKPGKNRISLWLYSLEKWNQEKRKEQFRIYYQKALKEDDKGRFSRANFYYKKANKYEASPSIIKQIKINRLILELEKRLKLNPGDYNAKIALGALYYAKGWLDKAENLWNNLESLYSDKPGIGFLLGCLKAKIAERKGQLLAAKNKYEESLKVADVFYVRNSLAELFQQEGFLLEAVQHWKTILNSHPYQLEVINSLAQVYLLLAKQEELNSLLKNTAYLTPFQLRQSQSYPQEVDPEYLVGLVSENDYFYQATLKLSQIYADLKDLAEAIRWRRISLEFEAKR